MEKNKIGILTLPFEANYGFILQAYALFKILKNEGCTPILINRGWNLNKNSLLHKFKRFIYYNYFCKNIISFFRLIEQTQVLRSDLELINECRKRGISKIIIGSDQVWAVHNTRGVGLNYFGNFIENNLNIKIYSYAASFGKDELFVDKEEKLCIDRLLRQFIHISVRETSGLSILKNEFGLNGEVVLDPTLLLPPNEWMKFVNKENSGNELVTYILDDTEEKRSAIKKFSKRNNLNIHNLYNRKNRPFFSVEHWLSEIANAKFVIVDSFHGMVFSIIFKKQFFAISNAKRGKTRFTSLLSKLDIEDRLIDNVSEINNRILKPIDYVKVYSTLKIERNKSMNYLLRIINN